MIEQIKKFEVDNNFLIQPFLLNKTGFQLIEGFYDAFLSYKLEIQRIKDAHLNFFAGNGYDEIKPEFQQVTWYATWFSEYLGALKKNHELSLTPDEKNRISKYLIDMFETSISCLDFLKLDDYELYRKYFVKLNYVMGFNDEIYITFLEYKERHEEIERLENEELINYLKAQKLSGRL